MISACANPDCSTPFDYHQGELFRFHKAHRVDEKPPNIHSVQHFWLCGRCCADFTLIYDQERGVLLAKRSEIAALNAKFRVVASA